MAEPVLLAGVELRGASTELGQPEMRVVAEAAAAARRIDDPAFPDALGDQRLRVPAAHEHEHAAIARAAPRRRATPASAASSLALLAASSAAGAGIARRVDARARRRAHRPRGPNRRRARGSPVAAAACRAFSSALSRKLVPVSSGAATPSAVWRTSSNGKAGEQRAKFAQLAGVAGRDDEPLARWHRRA